MTGPEKRDLVVEESMIDTSLARVLETKTGNLTTRQSIKPEDYASFGQNHLVLTRHQGAFVKPCPGTRGYICCGLKIIHFGLGCNIDCTYCILQGYLDTRALILFGNVDTGLAETERIIKARDPEARRFCTGEFTDSLLLEDMTGLGSRLVNIFSKNDHAVLELKTKTVNINGLLDLDHQGRTIISFSVNAPAISAREEKKAAPLKKRIEAAARAAAAGYRTAFHFDPIIRHPGWEDGYQRTVDDIYKRVPARSIAWISLGGFRYLPRLKSLVRRNHPQSRIMDDEFVLAPDGKMRYLRPLRVELYARLLEAIKKADPGACVYMCMESPRVWREVFGFDPGPDGLIQMLDQRV